MDIDPSDLDKQFLIAWRRWPIIRERELSVGLPTYCLFAVGSRETNLNPIYTQGAVGDGGHGHGIWQLDDRSHEIPPGFDRDIDQQSAVASDMLFSRITAYGESGGYNDYNSGSPLVDHTTGKDYGTDVVARRLYLVSRFPTNGEDDLYWGKDGSDLTQQIADARTAKCREWWLMYHGEREPTVNQLESAVGYWSSNGGDLTQAGIRDGRWGT